jgi:hypothetical protein
MTSRWRRLAQVAPIFLVAGPFSLWLTNGCAWEYEVVSTTDETSVEETSSTETSDETMEETSTDTGPFTLPDGRVCTGHDEDNDGVPDECDNCPNVSNPSQAGGAVGEACAPGSAFITAPSRLLFDPFKSFSAWKPYGSGSSIFALGDDMDSVVGGSALASECMKLDGGAEMCNLPYLLGSTGAGMSAVVATSVMTVTEEASGSAGLVMRAFGTPKRFYVCAVSVTNGFAVARAPDAGCDGGLCAPITFTMPLSDGGTGAAQLPIPSDVPHGIGIPIGIRASVTVSMGDGGILGDIECRVFDPKKPETLTSTDPKYAIKITAGGTRWFPSGEVGVYAQRSKATFSSIDVLRGP